VGVIVHIARIEEWEQAQVKGAYRTASLETQGFIHFSLPEQIVRTANTFYAGRTGLVLLCVDPVRLRSELRYEIGNESTGEVFPHLYGPLNLDAVMKVIDFSPGADGMFTLPEGIPSGRV
jgi:uncharacterized protein (DUF952 family)